MVIKTSMLAHIYEIQGYKDEAITIYKEVLKNNPNNKEAQESLIRLKTQQHKFSGANRDKLALFVNAKNNLDYQQLEEWLTTWN